MAIISDYATLCTAVSDYLARSDLSVYIPNFIQTAESKLYRGLRLRCMEKYISETIAAGLVQVPDDYLELKFINVAMTPAVSLERTSPETIYARFPVRSGAAIPKYIAREGDQFIFGPFPGNHLVLGIYYKRLPRLSSTNTTNWFTDNAPDALLYGSLLEAQAFLQKDARIPVWQQFFSESLKTIKEEEKRENASGSSMMVRAG